MSKVEKVMGMRSATEQRQGEPPESRHKGMKRKGHVGALYVVQEYWYTGQYRFRHHWEVIHRDAMDKGILSTRMPNGLPLATRRYHGQSGLSWREAHELMRRLRNKAAGG